MICAIMNIGSNFEFINGIFRDPFLAKLGYRLWNSWGSVIRVTGADRENSSPIDLLWF